MTLSGLHDVKVGMVYQGGALYSLYKTVSVHVSPNNTFGMTQSASSSPPCSVYTTTALERCHLWLSKTLGTAGLSLPNGF